MKNPLNWFKKTKPETPQPLREAYSPIGQTVDADDSEWRPLSGDAQRDLLPMTQRRMQNLAAYLWESNLLANRLIELPIAYILADGVKLKAEDETIQEVLDAFWNHPINNMPIKLVKKVRELSMYGEQCYPAFVNEFSGAVRLGYLDPCLIETVVVDPDNGEQPIGIVTVKNKKGENKRYKVIVNGAESDLFTQRTIAIRDTFTDGDCFYFHINALSHGKRGRSDLLPQTDWLDGYEQYMFGELDRVQFMRAFIWDVTLTGANEDDVKKRAAQITAPKPGGVRVHNDAEIWKTESPDLKAADTDTTAKLFRNHILGGGTIPEHWFGGAGDVNRATGEDMSGPTFKMMSMRQSFIGYMLEEIGKYVIRQWELAHNQTEPDLNDPIYKVCVHFPEMVVKDTTKYASALQQVTVAASQAITAKLLSRKTAIEIIESIAGRLGVSFDAEAELAAIDEQPALDTGVDNTEITTMTEAVMTKQKRITKKNELDPTPATAYTERLNMETSGAMDEMIKQLKHRVDTASDMEALREAVINSYPDIDTSALADTLFLAFVSADLAGRFDVLNDTQ